MNCPLTGCRERRLEQEEKRDQSRINYLHDLEDAETEIGARLEEYKNLFPEEIKNFLLDIHFKVLDEMED